MRGGVVKLGWLAAASMLSAVMMIPARGGLVPSPAPAVWWLSPRKFEVLHNGDVQATFRLEDAPEHGTSAVLLVNDTEVLRTTTTQPSVMLSGLAPGICELTVHVLHGGELIASASTLFLISSAALDPSGLGTQAPPDPDGEWKAAVAFGSDDWGRTADMIPIFPHLGELERTVREGWDPGSWGRATVETAADVERLFDIIDGLNVDGITPAHQRLVLSPYWMVGGPNFTAMAETGCPSADTCEYRECLIDESTGAPSAWPHCRGDLRQLYYSGFQNRLWHPQYHGRSHFDVQAWLSYLRSDEVAQKYFRRGMVFCNDTSLDTNQHPRTLLSEHVREHTIPGVSENNPSQVS